MKAATDRFWDSSLRKILLSALLISFGHHTVYIHRFQYYIYKPCSSESLTAFQHLPSSEIISAIRRICLLMSLHSEPLNSLLNSSTITDRKSFSGSEASGKSFTVAGNISLSSFPFRNTCPWKCSAIIFTHGRKSPNSCQLNIPRPALNALHLWLSQNFCPGYIREFLHSRYYYPSAFLYRRLIRKPRYCVWFTASRAVLH